MTKKKLLMVGMIPMKIGCKVDYFLQKKAKAKPWNMAESERDGAVAESNKLAKVEHLSVTVRINCKEIMCFRHILSDFKTDLAKMKSLKKIGGVGEIRTLVPITRQTHFECVPVRPLRYDSTEL